LRLGFRDGFGGGGWIVFGGAEGAHCGCCCCVYLLVMWIGGNPGRERLPLLSTIVVCSTIAQLYRRYRMNMELSVGESVLHLEQ